jgi:hypothetical protein
MWVGIDVMRVRRAYRHVLGHINLQQIGIGQRCACRRTLALPMPMRMPVPFGLPMAQTKCIETRSRSSRSASKRPFP